MKLDTRMVNLLGLLAIVAVLGLGAVGLVMPMYEGVQAANDEISVAESTNDGYRLQLVKLDEAEGRKAEIEQNLESLREELPSAVEGDTVLQVIARAVSDTGTFIDSDKFGEAVAFFPRPAATSDATASLENTPAPPADPAAAPTEGDAAKEPPASVQGDSTSGPKKQVELELEFSVKDTDMATAVLDALRSGPRSMLVTSAVAEKGSAHTVTGYEGTLKVTLLVFYYETGDAQ